MNHIITRTLAELYLKQGHLQEAYDIFKLLAEKDPQNAEIQNQLNELKKRLGAFTPLDQSPVLSKEEKIRFLREWLAHIRNHKPE